VERTLTELEQLVGEEREAIRRLDGSRVLELATRKQALVQQLCEHGAAMSPDHVNTLRTLVSRLRQNGVLLAHARNVLRDAVAVMRRETQPLVLPLPAGPAGGTISVRG
jgi:flagellar biosynthesis/type III secretory pathway chaperone